MYLYSTKKKLSQKAACFFKIYYSYCSPSHKFICASCYLHTPYLLFVHPINYFYIHCNLFQLSNNFRATQIQFTSAVAYNFITHTPMFLCFTSFCFRTPCLTPLFNLHSLSVQHPLAGCVLLRILITSDGNIIFGLFLFDLMQLGHKTSEGCTSLYLHEGVHVFMQSQKQATLILHKPLLLKLGYNQGKLKLQLKLFPTYVVLPQFF